MIKLYLPNNNTAPLLADGEFRNATLNFNHRIPITLTLEFTQNKLSTEGFDCTGSDVRFNVPHHITHDALMTICNDVELEGLLAACAQARAKLYTLHCDTARHLANKLYNSSITAITAVLNAVDTDNLSQPLFHHDSIITFAKNLYLSFITGEPMQGVGQIYGQNYLNYETADLHLDVSVSQLARSIAGLLNSELNQKLMDATDIHPVLLSAVRKLADFNHVSYGHWRDKVIDLPVNTGMGN